MAKLLKLRGGTTSQHGSFTGADREVTVDTDKETLVVHNGSQAGGFPLARADGSGSSNFTITGELDCATLDVSGNADIDGTLEADAMTLNGTAITTTATLSTGISNTNVLQCNANVADNDFLRIDGTSVEGRTAAETLSDIGAAPAAGSSNVVTTGALNSGSITSGFGTIDTGSSTITTTGAISGGSLTANGGVTVDNITIDGTEIDLSSGDLTLDVAGDIVLDAGGEQVIFKDGSTNVGHVDLDSDNFTLKSLVSDKDFIIKGNDGGSEITALTLDMSEAGAATFNNNVTAFSDERLKDNIETIDDGLAKVLSMRGVTYTRDLGRGLDKEDIGVIAQEVEKVIPEIVLTADDEMGTKSVDYGRITAVLIEAVKELTKRIEELENK